MPFTRMKMFLTERSRSAAEANNNRQGFFKLPPELRNFIFSLVLGGEHHIFKHGLFRQESKTFDRFAGARQVYHCDGRWYSQVSVPALFQVCRQMRREYIGMLFGAATLVLWLEDQSLSSRHSERDDLKKWCVDALDKSGIAALHCIEIRGDYECQGPRHRVVSTHYRGQSITAQGSVRITIDRRTEQIDVLPMYRQAYDTYLGASTEMCGGLVVNVKTVYPKPEEVYDCCRATSKKTLEQLLASIEALDMHKSDHTLSKADLSELRGLVEGKGCDQPAVEIKEHNENQRRFWRGRDRRPGASQLSHINDISKKARMTYDLRTLGTAGLC